MFHIFLHIFPCNNQRCEVEILAIFYFPPLAIAACTAASVAISRLKEKTENNKMEQALGRMQK